MIPPPKLDDRSFHDIVEEAISMIPRYSPEWTNHNPSDPGITLIELAAWMTDLILHRLNQVAALSPLRTWAIGQSKANGFACLGHPRMSHAGRTCRCLHSEPPVTFTFVVQLDV